jgi:hypothetical protein
LFYLLERKCLTTHRNKFSHSIYLLYIHTILYIWEKEEFSFEERAILNGKKRWNNPLYKSSGVVLTEDGEDMCMYIAHKYIDWMRKKMTLLSIAPKITTILPINKIIFFSALITIFFALHYLHNSTLFIAELMLLIAIFINWKKCVSHFHFQVKKIL